MTNKLIWSEQRQNLLNFIEQFKEAANYINILDAAYLAGLEDAKEKEKIICSAIKINGHIWRGHRHGHAMQAMRDELGWEMTGKELHNFYIGEDKLEQGFITSKGKYVSREEGRKLQDEAGIKSVDKDGYRGATLFSEDLYQYNSKRES